MTATSLIGLVPPDRYDGSAGVLACPGAQRLNVTVANQGVVMQLGQGIGTVVWDNSEEALLPSISYLERSCDAVRFRQRVPGLVGAARAVVDVAARGNDG